MEQLEKQQQSPQGKGHGKRRRGRGGQRAGNGDTGQGQRLARMIDPWAYWGQFGISLRKPSPVSFETLRQIAHACEPVAAIIQTRQNQVAAFCQKAVDDKPGWRVRMKDDKATPTEEDTRRTKEVEYFFEHLHAQVPTEVDERLVRGKDYPDGTFEAVMRAWVRDRLTLDAVAAEKTRTHDGSLFAVWPVDAGRIHRAFPDEAKEDPPNSTSAALDALTWMQDRQRYLRTGDHAIDQIAFVQEYRGREWIGWPARDFIYAYANPRTDMTHWGYGYSELEMLVSIVTAILNAIAYNKSQFTLGSIPPGLLTLYGAWDDDKVEAFIRQMEARLQGAVNQNRIPVLASRTAQQRGAEWINMRGANREMEYHTWLSFLMLIACAIYQIAPEEINLESGGRDGTPMFDKGPLAQLKHSKDKGLKPLLGFFATMLTREVVHEFYDDLVFEFVNLEPEDEAVKTDLMTKRVAAGYETVNMARAKNDEPRIEESWADAPANPVLMQVWMQEHMQQQQQAQMGPEAPEDQAQGYQRFLYDPQDGQQGQPPPGGQDPQQGELGAQARAQEPGASPTPAQPAMRKSLIVWPRDRLVKALGGVHRDVLRAARFYGEGL
jgi:hypothetical protein